MEPVSSASPCAAPRRRSARRRIFGKRSEPGLHDRLHHARAVDHDARLHVEGDAGLVLHRLRGSAGDELRPEPGQNDGDFNDFVYFISGLTCEGGGQPCQVPDLVGACAAGVTACGPGGTIVCSGRIGPTPELCDNIDNDCNGMVDDDPTLCTADNKVCYQGKCVPRCNTGEFQCLPGEMCNAEGLCIDAACSGIVCAEGEICRGGDCVGACDGVVCPFTANGRKNASSAAVWTSAR